MYTIICNKYIIRLAHVYIIHINRYYCVYGLRYIAAHAVTHYTHSRPFHLTHTHTGAREHLYVMPTTMLTPPRNNPSARLRWGTRKKNGIKKRKKSSSTHNNNMCVCIYILYKCVHNKTYILLYYIYIYCIIMCARVR